MKPIYRLVLLTITLILYEFSPAFSQVTVQVVRKKYEDKIDAASLKTLTISAEKSDIKIIATTANEISFSVEVATKHPEKKQVLEDYKKMKFLQEISGQTLYLRSYLLLEKNEPKPKSNFETTYIIYVPENLALNIKNTFGNVSVGGTNAELNATLKFCTTVVSKSDSKCIISTDYGSLKMMNLGNDVELTTKHTSIDLENIRGKLMIDSDYGKISLKPGERPKSITLKGNKTEVDVEIKNKPNYGIKITAKDTELHLPDFLKSIVSLDSKSHFFYHGSNAVLLYLDTNLGSINIK